MLEIQAEMGANNVHVKWPLPLLDYCTLVRENAPSQEEMPLEGGKSALQERIISDF